MISINVWKVDYSIYDFCPINILDSRNQWNALSNLFLSLKPQHKIDRPLMIYLPESCGVCLWKSFGPVWLFATSWAVACQAPLSMGISQARTPDWLAISFSRGLSQPRDWTQVSCIAGRFFTIWVIRKAQEYWSEYPIPFLGYLANPGIEPGSSVLQVDYLPTEIPGKPEICCSEL